jgi:hypothetical protein
VPRIVPSQVVALIDKVFPEAQQNLTADKFTLQRDHALGLAGIVRLVDEIPDELVRLEGERYGEFIAAVEGIRQSLETWPHQGASHRLGKIRGLYKLNPLSIVRAALASCPDDYPPAEVAGLEFIDDAEFRDNLRLDVAAINRAFSNNEFKAATVLAGSAIEALLLWALEKRTADDIGEALDRAVATNSLGKRPRGGLTDADWGIRQYAETTGELTLIKKRTREQLRLATDFRNLVHPGRAKRLNEACDRGTALATMAGLEFVMRDLAGR